MSEVTVVTKLGDLPLEEQKALKEWLRFKFHFFARPSFPELRKDLILEKGWDCSISFLRKTWEHMIKSDINKYQRFLSKDKSPQEFAARKWAIINLCAKICEDDSNTDSTKIKSMTLMMRTYKELERFYAEGGAEPNKGIPASGDASFPFTPEQLGDLERTMAMGKRLELPIDGEEEEDSEDDKD